MPGALVQLVALGVQDEKLTREPEMTFFKATWLPYVNFAVESIENPFQGVVDFGRKVQLDIQRNGDLVTICTLEVDVPEICVEGDTLAGQYYPPGPGPAGHNIPGILYPVPTEEGLRWAPNLGHTLIHDVSVVIGGSEIDKHYGIWFDAYDELIMPAEKLQGYNDMIGQENLEERATSQGGVDPWLTNAVAVAGGGVANNRVGQRAIELIKQGLQTTVTARDADGNLPGSEDALDDRADFNCHPATRVYVPLRFWFNTNPGLALPLIALQFHQVKIQVVFRPRLECITVRPTIDGERTATLVGTPSLQGASLWVDYVYLDNDARQYYAQNPHEYLIKQLQYNQGESVTSANPRVALNFNHPTSELVWYVQEDDATAPEENLWNWYDTFDPNGPLSLPAGQQPFASCKLRMNGQDRFAARTGTYFARVQPYHHHTRVPKSKGLASYAFGLDSEALQPQGTANLSRIDTLTLDMSLTNINAGNPGVCHVFAVNYNFFRVAGGMGGVAFAA